MNPDGGLRAAVFVRAGIVLLRIELADPLYRFVHPARFILCTRLKSVTWIGDFMQLRLLTFVLALLVACAPAFADDWLVIKLRGTVEQLVDTNWTALQRGDAVPDDRTVRTGPDGQVDLQRGKEVVTLGASTQVQIHDQTDTRFTTVQEDFGNVEVEAEVQNAPHFVVETQFLAAVVKGTHFTVVANDIGASVAVARGAVAVQSMASKRNTTVTIGQTVMVASTSDMVLGGTGPLPAVYSPDGSMFRAPMPDSAPIPVLPGSVTQATNSMPRTAPEATPVVTTAALVNPADLAVVGQLRGSLGSTLAPGTTSPGASSAPAKEEPPNLLTIAVGLLIGVVIGAVALALRRAVG